MSPPTNDGYAIIEQVSTKGKNSKTILHPMKVDFPKRSITAILGPSGSGKSTMLSVVTNSIQNNIHAKAVLDLAGHASFCPQDDRLHGFFTCRSYMKHYARLTGIAKQEGIDAKIDELLRKLGLSEQADTIVGDIFFSGLSGGQMRRLSVALEALTEPTNFFLDEPTSGLDSESALKIMEFLHDYAEGGRRVILTIHQPSAFIWDTIDHVILLSKGKLMYNGPRTEMESFFADTGYPTPEGWSRSDHYVSVVNDEFSQHQLSVDEWAGKFAQWSQFAGADSSRRRSTVADLKPTARSGSIAVAFELTYRYFLNLAFNPGILLTRIAMYSMLALMVGALFWDLGDRNDFESVQSRTAIAFYCCAFFVFMSVAVLPFTVMERAIVDKEVQNGYYNPIMYQLAQALSSIPGAAILAFVVTVIIIPMTKMNDPFWYFLNMFLALVVAEALALMVSHLVPHFIIGMALLAGMYGFFMLFQGFMIIPSEMPVWLEWVNSIAFHTYSWRSFMFIEFKLDNQFEGPFPTGREVLTFYEIDGVSVEDDMVVLACYALIVHALSCTILHMRYTLFKGKLEPLSEGFSLKPATVPEQAHPMMSRKVVGHSE